MARRASWLGMAAVAALVACSNAPTDAKPPAAISDYVWLERLPKQDTDFVHAMLLVKTLPIGVFIHASSYRSVSERFDVLRDGDRLKVRFPQTEKKAELTYRITRCDAPEPLDDVCLELSTNPWGGPRRYFGIELDQARTARELGGRFADVVPTSAPE